ncbi:Universal stress protein family protein [Anatilimnocola aggregata]|uniref:Universal stress protein family protein n=1 Tax=Anatilimnocola aggregata TaxID=2528021 RepID=A0A517YF94_9BACT|nr:universal stress protein [Anatilimnocola aggregata]QDU28908.1 Universal stress protein family protein [Anatilimnocola aggregata]
MIKRILVGLNGTQASDSAARQALLFAAEFSAQLIGVGVVDREQVCPHESVPLGAGEFKRERDTKLLQVAHDRIAALLQEFEQQSREAGVVVQTKKLEGEPADVLCMEAQCVDLLIVGKKHTREEEGDTSPATLQAILHQSPRPVLCVPAVADQRRPILIAYDGSLSANRAVQLFIASGLSNNRVVHLLTVGDHAAAIAEPCTQLLAAHGVHVEPHLAAAAPPAEVILELTARLDVGLLAMGAYGQSRFREFFFGSVTKTILKRATAPVFLYH